MKTIKSFESIYTYSTERLIAKKIESSDFEKLNQLHSDPDVMATLGGLRPAHQTKQDLEVVLKHWQENEFGVWLFYLKETGEWVGRASLRRLEVDGQTEVEIGYALLPKFWNQGFATEMASACAEIAFEVLRLEKIVCFTLTTNKASQRVMEKVGFQYEKDFVYVGLPHVLYRMKNPRTVEIADYSTKWPDFFQNEAKKIQNILGQEVLKIHHIGSTAIPNMPAKPVIDILLECNNLDNIQWISEKLNQLNYYNVRRHVIPHRSFFTRRQDIDVSYNVHIREKGDPQIRRHVNFRDYLIHHPDSALAYTDLKIKLAEKFNNDINSYVFGKDILVQEIDRTAKQWEGKEKHFLPSNTGPLAKDWSQEKLIKAMEANLNVHMTHFGQFLKQVELVRIPGYTLVNSGLPDDTFNYALEADFSSAEAAQKILEVTNYFLERNIPYSWWVSPYDRPSDLDKHLENHGYFNTENNVAMYFDLDAWDGQVLLIPSLEIIRARDEKTLRDFALVLTNDRESFKTYFSWIASILTDDDPIEYYVGYVNGKPVVRGLSCYFAQVAGLHWLSTAPDERKKGYGAAMQQFRLKRAKELGYHIAVLQASLQGYPLYQKLGYKECGVFKEFKFNLKL